MTQTTISQTPDCIQIQARLLEHNFDDSIPLVWANNNPVITAFYNALSTVIPEGEKFFIQSVNSVKDKIDDPQLKEEIKGFITQEASHQAEHKSLNNWIKSQGYPIDKIGKITVWLMNMARKYFSEKHKLACTIALEHMSSLLTEQFLRQKGINNELHPAMRRFFIWHSIEENEHKAVPYDVYQTLYGDYSPRVIQMLLIMLFFVPSVGYAHARYLWHDRQLFNIQAWIGAIKYFWISPAWFPRIATEFFRFFKPGYHPWQNDNSELINDWINYLEETEKVA